MSITFDTCVIISRKPIPVPSKHFISIVVIQELIAGAADASVVKHWITVAQQAEKAKRLLVPTVQDWIEGWNYRMSNTLQALLSLWGAVLATALGVLQLVKHFRDRPRILVNAELCFHATTREAETKGTLVENEHGPNEVLLLFTAANHGRQALQITACLVEEDNGNLQQVIPAGLPALLEPNTQVQVEIQKEWLDEVEVARLGVIDALGRIHEVDPSSVVRLVQRANALPSNKKEYRHRETGDIVKAFQAKDKTVLTRKNPRDASQ